MVSVSSAAENLGAGDPIGLSLLAHNPSDVTVSHPGGIRIGAMLGKVGIWNPGEATDLGTANTESVTLLANESRTYVVTLRIPDSVAPGGYRLTGWLDAGNLLPGGIRIEQLRFDPERCGHDSGASVDHFVWRGGSVSVRPFCQRYAHKAQVTLAPIESPGYVFSHWNGVTESHRDTATIRMDGDRTVTAHFTRLLSLRTELKGGGRSGFSLMKGSTAPERPSR